MTMYGIFSVLINIKIQVERRTNYVVSQNKREKLYLRSKITNKNKIQTCRNLDQKNADSQLSNVIHQQKQ